MSFYKNFLRPLVFQFDSEKIHDFTFQLVELSSKIGLEKILDTVYPKIQDPRLSVSVAGINFSNPIGLAAGFGKQAVGYPLFSSLGFGSVELGTITSKAQEGNPKPRIFRLEPDNALINRMGFPSIGIDAVLPRLSKIKKVSGCALGINIGKAKDIPLGNAAEDYQKLAKQVSNFADYVALNVSSPNTPDLRKLQEPERLQEIFELVLSSTNGKPVFVKLAPDIELVDLQPIIDVCLKSKIHALIATNTTVSRVDGLKSDSKIISETGGLSGSPLFQKSLQFVNTLSKFSRKQIPIIGVGGISNADNVIETIKAGASAVQVYTSVIYEGPFIARTICRDILSKLESLGLNSLSELI